MTLTAMWIQIWTVTFDPDNGGTWFTIDSVDNDSLLVAPTEPTAHGYRFTGWFTDDGDEWDFDADTVKGHMTLTAMWIQIWTVTFDPDNGGTWFTIDSVDNDSLIAAPTEPTAPGYRFTGWFIGDDEWVFTVDKVTGNVTLTAGWIQIWTVTFDPDNGEGSWTESDVDNDSLIAAPTEPTAPGHRFTGWFIGDDEWDFDIDTVKGYMTLTAGWIQIWTVTFDPDNGEGSWTESGVDNDSLIVVPTEPTTPGYKFIGWFIGDDEWVFTVDKVTGNVTLTAKWELIKDDGNMMLYLLIAAILAAVLAFLLFLLRRRPRVFGTVMQNGNGLAGVGIAYTVKKKGASGPAVVKHVTTKRSGKYSIIVPMGAEFTFVSVSKDNIDVPPMFIIEKRATELNFTVK
jgi:uncharacterized repeat protein (TIGR02543 family)